MGEIWSVHRTCPKFDRSEPFGVGVRTVQMRSGRDGGGSARWKEEGGRVDKHGPHMPGGWLSICQQGPRAEKGPKSAERDRQREGGRGERILIFPQFSLSSRAPSVLLICSGSGSDGEQRRQIPRHGDSFVLPPSDRMRQAFGSVLRGERYAPMNKIVRLLHSW